MSFSRGCLFLALVALIGCHSPPRELRSWDPPEEGIVGPGPETFAHVDSRALSVKLVALQCTAKGLREARVRPLDSQSLRRLLGDDTRVVTTLNEAGLPGTRMTFRIAEHLDF